MALVNPTLVSCPLQLSSPQIPVACLVDALFSQGFMGSRNLVTHSRHSGLYFDSRSLPYKRVYLQAVLSRAELFRKGVTSFRSDKPNAWYVLLMRSSTPIGNMSAAECQRILKTLSGGVDQQALDVVAIVPSPEVVVEIPALPDAAAFEIDGDDGEPVPVQDENSPSSSSSSSSSSPSHEIDGDGEAVAFVPPSIDGVKCHMEKHRHTNDEGLRVRCPVHVGCSKFRSLRRDVALWGPKASVLFLGAWLSGAEDHMDHHGAWKPTREDIRAYIRSHP